MVELQSIALLEELIVKLWTCYRVQWGDYFHTRLSSYIKIMIIHNVVVLIMH
jgi:hypothetical protein